MNDKTIDKVVNLFLESKELKELAFETKNFENTYTFKSLNNKIEDKSLLKDTAGKKTSVLSNSTNSKTKFSTNYLFVEQIKNNVYTFCILSHYKNFEIDIISTKISWFSVISEPNDESRKISVQQIFNYTHHKNCNEEVLNQLLTITNLKSTNLVTSSCVNYNNGLLQFDILKKRTKSNSIVNEEEFYSTSYYIKQNEKSIEIIHETQDISL